MAVGWSQSVISFYEYVSFCYVPRWQFTVINVHVHIRKGRFGFSFASALRVRCESVARALRVR